MIDMDHQIAGVKIGGLGNKILSPPRSARRPRDPVAENILLCENYEIRCIESTFQAEDSEANLVGLQALRRRPVGDHRQIFDTMFAQKLGQTIRRPFAIGGEQNPTARVAE